MKKLYIISILTTGLLSFASCSNENIISQTDGNGDEVITDVIVTADDFIPQTRTAISTGLNFTWVKNDKMGVFPETDPEDPSPSSQVQFTATAGGAGSVTFNGSGWGLMPNRKYYAYYPYSSTAADSLVKFSFKSSATQIKNDTTTHMGVNDLMYSSAIPAPGNTANFQFHHLSSIMKLEITVPNESVAQKFTKVVISCSDSVFPEVVSFNPTKDVINVTVEKKFKNLTLTLGNNGAGFAPVGGKLAVWFMIGAADLSGKTLNVKAYDTYDTYSGTFAGANQVAGKAHKYESTITKDARVDENYYVDLGLPSGKKWAIANLTTGGIPLKNTMLGDYYAWGDTVPYYESLTVKGEGNVAVSWKSEYSGGYTTANYNKNTVRGTYSTSSDVLSLADDAAHSVLGGNWRMPSKADLNELFNNCNVAATTVNNVKGALFTSRVNGKTIFFPCNGYFDGTTFKGYTASSPAARFWVTDNYNGSQAYQQYCSQDSPALSCDPKAKNRGCSIRPIYVPE